MSKHNAPTPTPRNHLLAALQTDEYQRILAQCEPITLDFGNVVYKPGDKIGDVFFPNSGIVSLLSAIGERSLLEIGIVGREGMIGLPVFLGVDRSANRAVVQGQGTALRLAAVHLLTECENGGSLPRILRRYTHSLMMQVSQTAVCNRFHNVDARLARWLLMTQDRMESDKFKMTQDFLSNMLGVRREAVTLAALDLQQKDLIAYERGTIKVVDRAGLEAVACICYSVVKNA